MTISWSKAEIEQSEKCYKDYIEVHLYDRNGKYMIKTCDSYGHIMMNEAFWVNFVTDDEIELRGWIMTYEQSFGKVISYKQKTRGKISSPLWPHLYPSNQDVQWTINGNVGVHAVHYELKEFDVPCKDIVRLYDGDDIMGDTIPSKLSLVATIFGCIYDLCAAQFALFEQLCIFVFSCFHFQLR